MGKLSSKEKTNRGRFAKAAKSKSSKIGKKAAAPREFKKHKKGR